MSARTFSSVATTLAIASIQSSPAAAASFGNATAQVTSVEATYAPYQIRVKTNIASGACAAGAVLTYNASGATDAAKVANGQSMLSLFMTAKLTGANIQYGGDDSGCTISYAILAG
jgi:flagellar capping protein FliD